MDGSAAGAESPARPPAPAPSWSRTGLRWTARLSALTATVLFALVLVAIHLERLIHQSTNELVATLRVDNGYFDDRVDFADLGRIRDTTQSLRQTLVQLDRAAAEDVRLLESIVPDVARLLEAGRTDLDIAHDLTEIAAALHTNSEHILRIADHADGTVASADARLTATVDLVTRLNRALGDIDRKLIIPEGAVPPAAITGAPALPELARPRIEVAPR